MVVRVCLGAPLVVGLAGTALASLVLSVPGSAWEPLIANTAHPLARLLLQLVVIVVTAKLLGAVARQIGQPAVIGETTAGVLLGPSLLGAQAPAVSEFLFPDDSLPALKLLSQIGVVLFMFVVGMELDLRHLRRNAQATGVIGCFSVVIPLGLGLSVAPLLYSTYAPAGVGLLPFALFFGVAMSVTAMPVLVRILEERGLLGTSLGQTALSCAAVSDVLAWSLLALVVAVAQASGLSSFAWTMALLGLFVLLMATAARPALRWLAADARAASGTVLSALLLFAFLAAWCTEVLGIHALFGAFLAGAVMPQHETLRQSLRARIEPFCALFLLPLFFAFTGLRTQVGLLGDALGLLTTAAIIAIAAAGKIGGTFLVARVVGHGAFDAFCLGALMNTRGLMELILLHLGYELGILSPSMFVMLVLMALITTFVTAPLLSWANYAARRRARSAESATG